MVPVVALWLPIAVSAVIVFLASWVVHMFLPHHRTDFRKLPQEDTLLDTLRSMNLPSGQYLAPYANTMAQMKQTEYMEKRRRGPALFLTLAAGPDPGMGKPLLQWFVFLFVISLIAAYLAGSALAPGTAYPTVFKFVCLSTLMVYALGHAHQSIWYRQEWHTTCNYFIDGLLYSLLTAGVFGWLWPH